MKYLIASIMVAIASNAMALEASPSINGEAWKKVGQGSYGALFITAYDIALYTPDGRYDPQKPHALAIQYRMGFSAEEINERSIDEMERAKPLNAPERTRFEAALNEVIPDVKEGDEIRAVFTPGKKTDFAKNGKSTGVIKDAEFTQKFSDIWLAEDTNAPELRQKLISE